MSRMWAWCGAIGIAACVMAGAQSFTNTAGPMTTARTNASAVLLNNGTVLVVGGTDSQQRPLASAEIFDPATSTFHATGSMGTARVSPIAALLPNGDVLVVGGAPQADLASTTEIYDPARGTFAPGPNLPKTLGSAEGIGLADGRVWITGFATDCTQMYLCPGVVYIYSGATGGFASAPPLNTGRRGEGLALLRDGRVLVASGWGDNPGTSPLETAELYDPAKLTDTLSAGDSPLDSYMAMATLPSGKVLIAGGDTHFGQTAEAWLYDPAQDTFTATAHAMGQERRTPQAFLLHDGTVLVAGGDSPADAEIYTPALDAFAPAGTFNTDQQGFAAVELQNGSVLFAGGGTDAAEVFTPAAAPSPDCSLTADSTMATVTTTTTATFQVAKGVNGFSSQIALTCGGDDGIQCAFAPSGIAPGETSTLTVSGIDLNGGPMVRFNAIGTSGSLVRTLPLQVNVQPPRAYLAPTRLAFGDQAVGTTSATQAVTLGNRGASDLDIASISVEGDFTENNNCPATISNAGGTTCAITVAFRPTAGGTRNGKLVITDNAPFSPQTVRCPATARRRRRRWPNWHPGAWCSVRPPWARPRRRRRSR